MIHLQVRRFASTLESVARSLRDRSYLRPHKPYTPPADVESRLNNIFVELLGSTSAQLTNGRIKFNVLNACFKQFNHGVPNSRLHEMVDTGKYFEPFPQLCNYSTFLYFWICRQHQVFLQGRSRHTCPSGKIQIHWAASQSLHPVWLSPIPPGDRHQIQWSQRLPTETYHHLRVEEQKEICRLPSQT